MARFVLVNAKMQRLEDLESHAKLEELGVDKDDLEDVEEVFNPVSIDFERVVTYMHHYNKNGDIVEGYSEITLVHGGYMVIEMPFSKVDKMLRGVSKIGEYYLKDPKLPEEL